MKNDKTYSAGRERAEALASRQAADPVSAAVHAELAQRYNAIARMPTRDEADGATADVPKETTVARYRSR